MMSVGRAREEVVEEEEESGRRWGMRARSALVDKGLVIFEAYAGFRSEHRPSLLDCLCKCKWQVRYSLTAEA